MRFYEEGSDILFGDFDDASFFHIEQTALYQKRLKSHGINSAEYLLLRPSESQNEIALLVVEAKKTLAVRGSNEFHANLTKIASQLMDSLKLAIGIWLGSYEGIVELPSNFDRFFERGRKITLILIIKDREGDMPKIADTLKHQYLRNESKLLGFDVKVYNEQQAISANLVVKEGAP